MRARYEIVLQRRVLQRQAQRKQARHRWRQNQPANEKKLEDESRLLEFEVKQSNSGEAQGSQSESVILDRSLSQNN